MPVRPCLLGRRLLGGGGGEDPLLEEGSLNKASNYVLVTGGTYWRGSQEVDFTAVNEYPQHKVTVSSFYIGKYEVTQKEWKEVMDKTVEEQHALSGQPAANFRGAGDDLPINFVNWFEAVEFCNRLSRKNGLTPAYTIVEGGTWLARTVEVQWNREADGWRLPTEAEWEYACRAGTTTRYNTGPKEEDLARAAWYLKNSQIEVDGAQKAMLHPVGEKEANAWGLYDMHGSVWEWCWDLYVANYNDYVSGALPTTNPVGAPEGENRVIRGGAFNNTITLTNSSAIDFFYSARRVVHEPKNRGQNNGFRIVRSFPSKPADTSDPAQPPEPEPPVTLEPPPPPAPDGFVYAPAGTFMMGGNPTGTTNSDSLPEHPVTLTKGFFVSKYEVTQKQWQEVMGKTLLQWLTDIGKTAGDSVGMGESQPIDFVNWYDALVFCNKMSIKDNLTPVYTISGSTNPDDWGTVPTNTSEADVRAVWNAVVWNHAANGYRLPTEAEWEYACRAGTTTKYNTGDTAENLDAAAWHGGNSSGTLHEVGKKQANNWGIFDMHGNVWEWCWDLYLNNYYTADSQTDPLGPETNSGGNHSYRGGAYSNTNTGTTDFFYCARRLNSNALRSKNTGFRVVRNAP